jgi:nucleoside-diphosphate-sugar epimerase
VNEGVRLVVNPNDPLDLYNISKLMAESACLQSGRNTVVARLSNVVGPDFSSDNFIFSLIREAYDSKLIRLQSAAESKKDFILLKDAVQAIVVLGEHYNPKPIYNIASGRNLSSAQICEVIAGVEHCRWEVATGAPLLSFPDIDISRARQDLGLMPGNVLDSLEDLVCQYREKKGTAHGHTH